jgi:hypothetical protein
MGIGGQFGVPPLGGKALDRRNPANSGVYRLKPGLQTAAILS